MMLSLILTIYILVLIYRHESESGCLEIPAYLLFLTMVADFYFLQRLL